MKTWVLRRTESDVWEILPLYFQRRICERVVKRWGVHTHSLEISGDRSHIGLLFPGDDQHCAEIKCMEIEPLLVAIHRKTKTRFVRP